MQNVSSKKEYGKSIVLETDETRKQLFDQHLTEHGVDIHHVYSIAELLQAVQDHCFECIIIADTQLSTEELSTVGLHVKEKSICDAHVVLITPQSPLSPVEAHQAGYSYVLQGNIDFGVLCDIISRASEANRCRLFDGGQLRIANKIGPVSYANFKNKKKADIELMVGSLGAGGFCYSSKSAEGRPMPEEGSELFFDIQLAMFPDYNIKGHGIVSWIKNHSDGSYSVGVEFVTIPSESEHLLKIYADLFKVREFVPTKAA